MTKEQQTIHLLTLEALSPHLQEQAQPGLKWLEERLADLPEYTVKPYPNFEETPDNPWKQIIGEDGVTRIRRPDGAFFAVQNNQIELHLPNGKVIKWTQPLFHQKGVETPVNTGGETLSVTGLVILLQDTEGNTLISLGQEPGAPARQNEEGKETHPALRTPLQMSMSKLIAIMEGKETVDGKLKAVLEKTGLLVDGELNLHQLPMAISIDDANRVKALTLISGIVTDPETLEEIKQLYGDDAHIATPAEMVAFSTTGLPNGHLQTAKTIAKDLRAITSPEQHAELTLQELASIIPGETLVQAVLAFADQLRSAHPNTES